MSSSSFFLAKGSKKRKAPGGNKNNTKVNNSKITKKKKRTAAFDVGSEDLKDNEEILSDASDVEGNPDAGYSSNEDEANKETADDKRLRLAKIYLEELEKEELERLNKEEDDDETNKHLENAINERLKTDDLEKTGKLRLDIAQNYEKEDLVDQVKLFRDHNVHKSSVTCLAVTKDGSTVISGSKDGGLVWWKLELDSSGMPKMVRIARVAGGRKGHEATYKGHCDSVNAVAVSSDGKFFASGDDLHLIHIWKLKAPKPDENNEDKSLREFVEKVHTFKGHRSPVSGLAFRKGTHNLYSCSHDRSVKSWNLDEMSYVETLFGHQDRITGIDAGLRERAITAGGRDGTVRVWKIVEESQLVFNTPSIGSSGAGATTSGSVDGVKLIDEEHFATCGEDGHLSLWSVMKKKPICTIKRAHGTDSINEEPRWLTALATQHNTDLLASGSQDGHVRLWKANTKTRRLQQMADIDLSNILPGCDASNPGFVNSISLHPSGKALILGMGQEHRLGRWWRHKAAKNGIVVITLKPSSSETE